MTESRTAVLTRALRAMTPHKCAEDLRCRVEASGKSSRHERPGCKLQHRASRVELSGLAPKIRNPPPKANKLTFLANFQTDGQKLIRHISVR